MGSTSSHRPPAAARHQGISPLSSRYFPVGGSPDVLTNDFNKQIAEFGEMFKAGLIKLE